MIRNENTELDFIPKGYTPVLQVVDVGVNKSMISNINDMECDWMRRTKSNKHPHRKDIAYWVSESWKSLRMDIVKNTWYGIRFKDAETQRNDPGYSLYV